MHTRFSHDEALRGGGCHLPDTSFNKDWGNLSNWFEWSWAVIKIKCLRRVIPPPVPPAAPPPPLRPATAIIAKTSGIHHHYKSRLLATHPTWSHVKWPWPHTGWHHGRRMAYLFHQPPTSLTRCAFIHVEAYELWVKIITAPISARGYFPPPTSPFIYEPRGAVNVNMGPSPL